MRLALVLLGMLLAAATGVAGRAAAASHARSGAAAPQAPSATDLDGHPVRQLAPAGTRAVVLFFIATDCPISNRYVPAMEELAAAGAHSGDRPGGIPGQKPEDNAGVLLWWVYPNPADTADAVRAHQLRYSIGGGALLDTEHTLVRMAKATVTPEAAVLVPDARAAGGLRVVYHGRIDDRYGALGRERPQATHHDLADALSAALAGRPVPAPGGPPVGCAIVPLPR